MKLISKHLLLLFLFLPLLAHANLTERKEVQDFISKMVTEHQFDKQELEALFSKVEIKDSIIKAITRPAEAMPWYKYRPIFLKNDRINLGVKFWQENRKVLERAEQEFGVPPEIIVAIIGVETRYGNIKGSYNVVESPSTLDFDYPKRSKFFASELEHFLLLAREQELDPSTVTGSYAGAMGIPQFISSSYRAYAHDFDGDGHINIWTNYDDAIGSVANYFKVHGWKEQASVALPATVNGEQYRNILKDDLKFSFPAKQLTQYGINPGVALNPEQQVKLLEFETKSGHEYWLGFDNFYVISRYNHSKLYSMAVFQLATEIRARFVESDA
jgi:membrane-bound lytic murein transglycosylase B